MWEYFEIQDYKMYFTPKHPISEYNKREALSGLDPTLKLSPIMLEVIQSIYVKTIFQYFIFFFPNADFSYQSWPRAKK